MSVNRGNRFTSILAPSIIRSTLSVEDLGRRTCRKRIRITFWKFSWLSESFLAITISRGGKCRGLIHQSIENVKAVRMVCHSNVWHSNGTVVSNGTVASTQTALSHTTSGTQMALKRKFKMCGVLFIFYNSFLVITISRGEKFRCRIHQSIENSKAVRVICRVLYSKVNSRQTARFSFFITGFWLLLFHAMTKIGVTYPNR